jgi:hypothetical protein
MVRKVQRELTVPKLLTVPDRDLFNQRLIQAASALKHEYKSIEILALDYGHNPVEETVLGHGLALSHVAARNAGVMDFLLNH